MSTLINTLKFKDNHVNEGLSRRFERLGDLNDINKYVLVFEDAVRLTPDSRLQG
jgi:hypothetical protein